MPDRDLRLARAGRHFMTKGSFHDDARPRFAICVAGASTKGDKETNLTSGTGKLCNKCLPRVPLYYALCFFEHQHPGSTDEDSYPKLHYAGYRNMCPTRLRSMRQRRYDAVRKALGAIDILQPRLGAKMLQQALEDYDVAIQDVKVVP